MNDVLAVMGASSYASVECVNALDKSKRIEVLGVVDDQASDLVLPSIFRAKLGDLEKEIEATTRIGGRTEPLRGVILGPVLVRIGSIRWMSTEAFLATEELQDQNAIIGRTPLAQTPAEFDRQKKQLVRRRSFDLRRTAMSQRIRNPQSELRNL